MPIEAKADQELMRVEAHYLLAEHSFDEASQALMKFLRSHLGVTAPLIKRQGIIFARVNELRDKNPELRKLENAQARAKRVRDGLLQQRAELRKALGLVR